jgi:hypothetical protein
MGLSIDTKNLQTLVKNFWGTTAGTFFNKFKEKASKASGNLKNVYNSLATISSVKRNKPDENKLSEIFASALSHFQRSSESESSNAPSGLVGTDVRTLTHEDILYDILEFDFANECSYPDGNRPNDKENCLRALSILLFVFGEDIKNKPELFPKDLKDSLSFFATKTTHAENKQKFKDSFNGWLVSKRVDEETIGQILDHFDTNFNVVVFDNNECMCQFKFDKNDGEELKNVKVGITLSSKVGILDTLEKKFEEFKFSDLTLSWLFSGGKPKQKLLPSSDYHAVSQQKPATYEEECINKLTQFNPVTTSHGLVNTSGEFFSFHKYSASNFPHSAQASVYNGMAVFNFMGEIFYNRKSNQDLNNDKLLERACSKFSSSTSATELKNDSSSSEDLINTLINWNFAAQKSYGHDSPDEKNKQFTALCIILQIYQQEIKNGREALGNDSKSFITNFEKWLNDKNISNSKNIVDCFNDNFTVVSQKDGKQISCQFKQKFKNSKGYELTLGITISGKGVKSPRNSKLSPDKIRQMQEELLRLQSEKDELTDLNNQLTEEINLFNNTFHATTNQTQRSTSVSGSESISRLKIEKTELEGQLKSKQERINQLELQLQLIGNDIDSLQEDDQTKYDYNASLGAQLISELDSLSTAPEGKFAQLRNNIFEEKDQELQQKNQELQRKDDRIELKNQIIKEKDGVIKQQDEFIQQQKQEIEQQKQEIEQQKQEIKRQNEVIERQNQENEQKDEVIEQQKQENEQLKQQISHLSTQQQSPASQATNSTLIPNRPKHPFLDQISGGVQHRLKKVPKSDEVAKSSQTPKPSAAGSSGVVGELKLRLASTNSQQKDQSQGGKHDGKVVKHKIVKKPIGEVVLDNFLPLTTFTKSINDGIRVTEKLRNEKNSMNVIRIKELYQKVNEVIIGSETDKTKGLAKTLIHEPLELKYNQAENSFALTKEKGEQELKKLSDDYIAELDKYDKAIQDIRSSEEKDKDEAIRKVDNELATKEKQFKNSKTKKEEQLNLLRKEHFQVVDDLKEEQKGKFDQYLTQLSTIVDKINSGRNAYLEDPEGQKSWYDGLLAQIKAVGVNDNAVAVK